MSPAWGPITTVLTESLETLQAVNTPTGYRDLRKQVSAVAARRSQDWLAAALADDETRTNALLLAAATTVPLDFDLLGEDLAPRGTRACTAAFCLVERFDDPAVFRQLLLAGSAHEAPRIVDDAAYYTIAFLGLAQQHHAIPVLEAVLERQYHYHPPAHTALALQRLGKEVDVEAHGLRRSITVSQTGSRLLIHLDSRFTGSSSCPTCKRFFPCRVNHYYRGAIQDCKLWNRTDPASLLELHDYRPADERGPTIPAETDSAEENLAESIREADHHEDQGHLSKAAEILRVAARDIRDPNERLRLLTRSMRLLVRAGDRPAAYGLMTLTVDKAREATDDRVLERWDRTRLLLLDELGAYATTGHDSARTPFGRNQADLLAHLRSGTDHDHESLDATIRRIEAQLQRERADRWTRYRWLSYLVSLCALRGEPARSQHALTHAFRSPPTDVDEALERSVLDMRQAGAMGDIQKATNDARRLRSQIDRLRDLDRRLEYIGHTLEALGAERELDATAILTDAEQIRQLYRRVLADLHTAPTRRRLRQRHQRTIESALLALSRVAESQTGSDARQAAWHAAWRLIINTRNPELQRQNTIPDEGMARRMGGIEDSLHRGLAYHHDKIEALRREMKIDPKAPPPEKYLREISHHRQTFVTGFLQKVLDFELAHVRRSPENEVKVAHEGLPFGALWFEARELMPPDSFLVLGARDGRISGRWLLADRCNATATIEQWRRHIESMAKRGERVLVSRDVSTPQSRVSAVQAVHPTRLANAVESLLPEDLLVASDLRIQHDFYPDGALYTLPLEALPDPVNPGSYLGERLATRYCLRPRPRLSRDSKIDLDRGWLGLGFVPPYDLQETREEIAGLTASLTRAGIENVETLIGEDGHVGNLTAALERMAPAVLHLAVHGNADPQYPDACYLQLAMEPGGAPGPLLPFRALRDLPLGSVRLTVLSACRSLVGPVGAGTGVEGLAWALLEAGVDYVLATRYPIDDRHSRDFMMLFYSFLMDHPPAEALRQARVAGLREKGLPLFQIAAWALWC